MRRLFFLLPVFLMSFMFNTSAETDPIVEIQITNIRNNTGSFVLGFYKDNKSFSKREPFMRKEVSKANLSNGVVLYKLSLPVGTYGIALLDDENKNGKMDYGFILPNEGFGFSDYYHRGLTAPSFEDFDFNVTSNRRVEIKVKYM